MIIYGVDSELVRILAAAAMLGCAAFFDLRKREVSDLLWVFFGIFAAAVYALEFAFGGTFDIMTGIHVIAAGAVAFGVYKAGLFGGADMLALIVLAALLPTLSAGILEILPAGRENMLHPIAPLTVLSNAVTLSVSMIGINLARNVIYASKNPGMLFEGLEHEPAGKKIIAAAIGYRASGTPRYAFSIEQQVEGRRQFSFATKDAETAEYESRQNVWVTAGTPFLAFMLVGFLVMLFVGDIAGIALRLFL